MKEKLKTYERTRRKGAGRKPKWNKLEDELLKHVIAKCQADLRITIVDMRKDAFRVASGSSITDCKGSDG